MQIIYKLKPYVFFLLNKFNANLFFVRKKKAL